MQDLGHGLVSGRVSEAGLRADVTPDPWIAEAVRLTIFGPSDDDEGTVPFEATARMERHA